LFKSYFGYLRMRFFLLAIAVVLASFAAPASSAAQEASPLLPYRPGAVLVGFPPGATVASVGALAAAGYEVTRELPELNAVEVPVPVGSEEAVAAQLARLPGVDYAEPDYWASPQGAQAVTPDDQFYGDQWALPVIRAPEAWSITTGSGNVVIAVIDSGVDLVHPDLRDKLWVNTGETPFNGKDDDGNGKVDDVHGWHFFQAWNGQTYESRENGHVMDDSGHGTHVAGIAAAKANNRQGIAGIAWNSPVMAVKVIDKTIGLAAYSDVAAGIQYAVDNGALILNISLGGAPPSQILCGAVSGAASRGAIVVAAAGNEDNSVYYPAACPGALAVGATDRADNSASFSNPGARVDLAAPGVDIYSTWFASGLGAHNYAYLSGTSEAAPHVAAAAALVWARWPALTAEGVKAQLQGSVVDVGLPGRDDESGWGRLDLAAALAEQVRPVDLRLQAAASPLVVVAGNPLTATFSVSNAGAAPATSVTLSAALPADPVFDVIQVATSACSLKASQMRCGFARLDPGATVGVTVVITPTSTADGHLTTSASVNAAQRELTPSDNRQTITTEIKPVLWGRIFLDGNGDGVRQPWETRGVTGALVLLERVGQPVAYTATEPPGGLFRFDTLPSGRYAVIAELPHGYQFTTPGQVQVEVLSNREQTAFIGAWTGEVQPIPGRLRLPLILATR
jgi:subtilisin family serine protease